MYGVFSGANTYQRDKNELVLSHEAAEGSELGPTLPSVCMTLDWSLIPWCLRAFIKDQGYNNLCPGAAVGSKL